MYFDYGFVLVVLCTISGVIWLLDHLKWKPKRQAIADSLKARDAQIPEQKLQEVLAEPIAVDYSRSFFPILIIILLLRSFLYEPFRIPSGSMMPTLLIGDLILVNKYDYGVRLPVTHSKIWERNKPRRGDVMVFKFPDNPKQDYIKRVVGLPGDRIVYDRDKNLRIIPSCEHKIEEQCNKEILIPAIKDNEKQFNYFDENFGQERQLNIFTEHFGERKHQILRDPFQRLIRSYPFDNNYVPEKHYFVMGDNRDNSSDSRIWGFVPEEYVVGRAVAVWFHVRLEYTEKPILLGMRLPKGIDIDFGRVGGIQ